MKHVKRSPTTPAARQSAAWCRVSPFVSPALSGTMLCGRPPAAAAVSCWLFYTPLGRPQGGQSPVPCHWLREGGSEGPRYARAAQHLRRSLPRGHLHPLQCLPFPTRPADWPPNCHTGWRVGRKFHTHKVGKEQAGGPFSHSAEAADFSKAEGTLVSCHGTVQPPQLNGVTHKKGYCTFNNINIEDDTHP